jgi:hypothetical protein
MQADEEITQVPEREQHQLGDRKNKAADGGTAEMALEVDDLAKPRDNRVVDAVWGVIDEDGPNYRNLGWYVH